MKKIAEHALESGGCRILIRFRIAKGNGKDSDARLGFCCFWPLDEYFRIYLASVCRERDIDT